MAHDQPTQTHLIFASSAPVEGVALKYQKLTLLGAGHVRLSIGFQLDLERNFIDSHEHSGSQPSLRLGRIESCNRHPGYPEPWTGQYTAIPQPGQFRDIISHYGSVLRFKHPVRSTPVCAKDGRISSERRKAALPLLSWRNRLTVLIGVVTALCSPTPPSVILPSLVPSLFATATSINVDFKGGSKREVGGHDRDFMKKHGEPHRFS